MNGRFGITMLIDVLRGAKSQRITKTKMDKLPTYGILKKETTELRADINYLLQLKYLQILGDEYPLISVTAKANEILFNKKKLQIPEHANKNGENDGKSSKKASKTKPQYSVDENLLNDLKKLRLQIAQIQQVPAFTVFSDVTLYDMCRKLPTTDAEFLGVSGVGDVKLKRYGEKFLEVLTSYKNSGVATQPYEQLTNKKEIANLFANFEFSAEPVSISVFLQSANILLVQTIGKGTTALKLSQLLEQDGFLEMKEMPTWRGRVPTKKGQNIGITSVLVENADGNSYMQNLYSSNAQAVLLKYLQEMSSHL